MRVLAITVEVGRVPALLVAGVCVGEPNFTCPAPSGDAPGGNGDAGDISTPIPWRIDRRATFTFTSFMKCLRPALVLIGLKRP